jgi:hypothetical protein
LTQGPQKVHGQEKEIPKQRSEKLERILDAKDELEAVFVRKEATHDTRVVSNV